MHRPDMFLAAPPITSRVARSKPSPVDELVVYLCTNAPSPSCHALVDKPKSPSFLRRLTLRLHLLFCSRVPGFILHNQGQSPDCSHDVHVHTTSTRAQHRPAIPLSIDAGADVVVQSAAALRRARVLWVPRIRPAFPIPTSPASSTSTRPSLSHVAVCPAVTPVLSPSPSCALIVTPGTSFSFPSISPSSSFSPPYLSASSPSPPSIVLLLGPADQCARY